MNLDGSISEFNGKKNNLFEFMRLKMLFLNALITPFASTPGCLKKFLSSADKNEFITFF